MIIFGTRRSVRQLAMLMLVCGFCGRQAAHPLTKIVTKFTLFFVPLFPVRTRYAIQCTACGGSTQVDRQRADEMQRGAIGPGPQQPYPGQQSYPGPQQYPGNR